MRKRYSIPDEWSDEDARAVIGFRYEFDLRGITNLPTYTFLEDVTDQQLSAILESQQELSSFWTGRIFLSRNCEVSRPA